MPDTRSPHDLTRSTLDVLFVCALIVFTAWIALPFLSALVWAAMIVISTWPMLLKIQSRLGGRRGLATTVMTVVLLLVLVIPLTAAVGALIANMDKIVAKAAALRTFELPPPPDWVARIPFTGPQLSAEWLSISGAGPGSLSARLAPYSGDALRWFAARIGGMGGMVLQFLVTVIISAILYANGEAVAQGIRRFAVRVAGARGDQAAVLAARTIRGVALGVILTALVQTILAGAGLVLGSVPGAGLLTAAAALFCIAQIGPILVLLPAVIWKFNSGDTLGATILLCFSLVACTIDNVLRPYLIKKGADLPLVLIFAGVIGGMISFGVMGIFVGPVILAVSYVLLREWVMQPEAEAAAAASARTPRAS